MPMYMKDVDYLVFETCNTPHGDGTHSYTTVKYKMPLLFYNHCDYMYEDLDGQKKLSDKVGELVDKYDYMFVREDQLAKAASAAYNTDIKADISDDGKIIISKSVRDSSRRLYDKRYTDCIGVRIVFADNVDASKYWTDANVYSAENNTLTVSLDNTVTIEKGVIEELNIKGVNVPANIKSNNNSAVIKFLDGGMMSVRVKGEAETTSDGWKVYKDGNDTVFTKFGDGERLKIKQN